MRRKNKKSLAAIEAKPIVIPCCPNYTRPIDFMTESVTSSKRFRTFNAIDDFSRVGLAIVAAIYIPGLRLSRI
jgi:putative transposase